LASRPLPLPNAPAGTETYYISWLEMLNAPETLPDSMIEALLAIEALAAPENRQLLEEKVSCGLVVMEAQKPVRPVI